MTTIIGASAMIGTVCDATIHGIIERSSQRMETMRTAKPDAQRRADGETDQRLFERNRPMINEAALRRRRSVEDELIEFRRDLMRRGQLRPLHIERRPNKVLGRIIGAPRVGELVALERRVHERRGDIPKRKDGDDDRGDGERGFDARRSFWEG